jgi:hypothetical protein
MTFSIKSLLFWVTYLVKMIKVFKKKSYIIKIIYFPYKCCVSLSYEKPLEALCLYIACRVYENIIIRPIFLILNNNPLNKIPDIIT